MGEDKWILWLKVLGLEETKENMEGSSGGRYEEFEVKEIRCVGSC